MKRSFAALLPIVVVIVTDTAFAAGAGGKLPQYCSSDNQVSITAKIISVDRKQDTIEINSNDVCKIRLINLDFAPRSGCKPGLTVTAWGVVSVNPFNNTGELKQIYSYQCR